MKSFFYFLALVVFLGCTSDEGVELRDAQMLDKLAIEIADLIESSECSEQSQCAYIAFGSKPCGGPWGYLVYSTTIDVNLLEYKVNLYNQIQREYNQRNRVVSDCLVASPPSALVCEDGRCRAAD